MTSRYAGPAGRLLGGIATAGALVLLVPGQAVVLGHVDSARSGPGVFFDLRAAAPGDAIAVTRADGSVARFRVDRIGTYPKSAFPTAEVYGDLDHPGLRLITCGGHFDRAARSWTDNVIVYASAASEQVG
jgi:sortase (surface protein transpeptidase)